jgi:hypothetical protein
MSKKFSVIFLTLFLITTFIGCNKTANSNNTTNNVNNTTANNTNNTTASNTTEANNLTDSDGKIIPVNMPAGANVVLPKDVPTFPNATVKGKRITNKITMFDFQTKSNSKEVNDFFIEALKKEGWQLRIQQANSKEGLYFTKPKRSIKVISYPNGKEKLTDFTIHVVDISDNPIAQQIEVADKDDKKTPINVGNLNEAMKMSATLPSDVPFYPGATRKPTDKPGLWWEYKTKDNVKKIADWYSGELKAKNWDVHLDTSELGDSMVIYTKNNEQGDKMYVGVRVNDIKQADERWITLINYPYNTVIPKDIKPLSVVEKEQAGTVKAIQEATKKAQELKKKAEKETNKK